MRAAIIVGSILLLPLFGLAMFQQPVDADHELVNYAKATPTDPIARLQEKIDRGEVILKFDERWGYLPSLMEALKIPLSSQSLVFSKTSLQLLKITPETPRALYFNDEVYLGWVFGGSIVEIASTDPQLGTVFYSLPQDKDAPPRFQREFSACLMCHDSASTGRVPGVMMLSTFTDKNGAVQPAAGMDPVWDTTPLENRYGGWYVTGTHGSQLHRGNVFAPLNGDSIGNAKTYADRMDWSAGANVLDLEDRIDAKRYMSKHSDIVALLALTHQLRIHNLITRANYELKPALRDEELYYNILATPGSPYSDVTAGKMRVVLDPLLRAMLFAREAQLSAPVAGTTEFAAEFQKLGPHDRKGRSLRDLDLNRRLLRYPLSYLIYSESFNALPEQAKAFFYERLGQVLTCQDASRDFTHLTLADRESILEILKDTKPDFAAIFAKSKVQQCNPEG